MAIQTILDTHCRIELFGWLRIQQGNRCITRFQTQKTGVLLALLAFYPHRSRPREELVEMLWPGEDIDSARHKLRMALSSLRRQLEPPGVPAGSVILADRISIQLNPAVVITDVAEFEAATEAAARATSAAERRQQFTTAVDLYRGTLLPGYYEEWIEPERERLGEAFIHTLQQLSADLQQVGDLARAIGYARRAVEADPLREEAHSLLIRLLKAAGQPRAALRQYLELERVLDEELDTTPTPAIAEFVRQLQESPASPAGPQEIGPAGIGRRSPGARPAATARPLGGLTARSDQPGTQPPESAPALLESPLLTGTITLLLAEIQGTPGPNGEGSAGVPPAEREAVCALLEPVFSRCGGRALPAPPESVWMAFGRASEALAAAVAGQQSLARQCHSPDGALLGDRRHVPAVRMALHTGELQPGEEVRQSRVLPLATRLLLAAHPHQILLSEKTATLLRGELEGSLTLVNLGLYRLHEQSEPEYLFQIVDAQSGRQDLPPPNALPGLRNNLPPQFTRFFGREGEIAELRELLAQGARLITVSGPGGQGKTRLALEWASRVMEQFPGGVWFVPLADVTDARAIPEAVLEALRLPRSPRSEVMEQVVEALSAERTLLILDNVEQLLPEGAAVVRTLLERAATLVVMTTSRQCLGLTPEHAFALLPLRMPRRASSPEQLLRYETVQLFVDRAQSVRADFQVTASNMAAVAQLCARLEGLPLAIELAAARIGVLTPAQMVLRLKQRFDLLVSRKKDALPRHRTLRAAIDWSYQLLSPKLQQFFLRLSVFRGGWTSEAAEAIATSAMGEPPAVSPSRTLEALTQLQECSLVLADGTGQETRFSMLESLRQYAVEQLDATARADLSRRHMEHYLCLAEQAEPHLYGPEQGLWMDRLEKEHANIRAALRYLELSKQGEPGLRLAGALWRFWYVRGYWKLGRVRLAALLALPGTPATAARAKALHGAGTLAYYQGEYREARALLEDSLSLSRQLAMEQIQAQTLASLGFLARAQGEDRAASQLFQESQQIWERLDHKGGMALSLGGLAEVALAQGDLETARTLYYESLILREATGDKRLLAAGLNRLGDVARIQGDPHTARTLYEQGLTLTGEIRSIGGTAGSLTGLGKVALGQGDWLAARSFFLDSLRIRQQLGDRRGVAECLEGLAATAASQGQWERAGQLFGLAETVRDGLKRESEPADIEEAPHGHSGSSDGSTVHRFLAAWSSGRRTPLEQALTSLLTEGEEAVNRDLAVSRSAIGFTEVIQHANHLGGRRRVEHSDH